MDKGSSRFREELTGDDHDHQGKVLQLTVNIMKELKARPQLLIESWIMLSTL